MDVILRSVLPFVAMLIVLIVVHELGHFVTAKLAGVKVGIMGLSFKPQTDDVRESPAIELIQMLLSEAAEVRTYDPMARVRARQILPSTVEIVDSPAEIGADIAVTLAALLTAGPDVLARALANMEPAARARVAALLPTDVSAEPIDPVS